MAQNPGTSLLCNTALLDAMLEGALLADTAGLVVYCNESAERIFGAAHGELLIPLSVYPIRYSLRAPAEESPPILITSRALAGETVPPVERFIRRPDGAERVLRVSASPMRDEEGRIERALTVIVDVTDLRERERLEFQLFFDAMPQLGWTATPSGYIDYYNRGWYAYTGTTLEEMKGLGWQSVHDPALLPLVMERWGRSLATGTPFEMEFTLRRHDGARRWFLTRVNPLLDRDGRIFRWVGINTDIDAQKVAEADARELLARAQAASRVKDEFLAMLGHELRNPLAPILTAVQLMQLDGAGPAREREVIERHARHLTRLVDGLLDLSRVQQGKIELQLRDLRLRDAVVSGVEMALPALEGAHHDLVVDVPEDLWLRGDEMRLAQIVANLIGNAAKYTPPGGHVRVEARSESGKITLLIKDDGIGVEPELLPRIFDLFTQGARRPDRGEGGLGLGLTLARTLTELHGGTVTARSEGRGRGTEIAVRLPGIAPPAAEALAATSAPPPPRRRKILVVDDNADAGSMLALLLRKAGHEVETAIDAVSGEELARTFSPNVGVLDLGLPEIDGVELARRLKALDPRIVLIAVTGYGEDADLRRTAEAGFAHHLVKPVSGETLLASIEAAT